MKVELWKRRGNEPLPMRLGDMMGCRFAEFMKDKKPDQGKKGPQRIIVSETIWR